MEPCTHENQARPQECTYCLHAEIRALESKLAEAEKETSRLREEMGAVERRMQWTVDQNAKAQCAIPDSISPTATLPERVASLRAEVERLRGVPYDTGPDGEPNGPCLKDYVDLQTAHSEACDRVKELAAELEQEKRNRIMLSKLAPENRALSDRIKELEGALHQLWISCAVREIPHGKVRPSDPMPYSWQKPNAADLVPIWRLVAALRRPEPRQEEESDGS